MPTRDRYGWSILTLVALVALVYGVRLLLTGAPVNPVLVHRLTGQDWPEFRQAQPEIARLVSIVARHEGLALLGWGIWLMCGSVRGYRAGERWVWFAWWTVPAFILAVRITGAASGGALEFLLVGVGLLAVIGLVLSRPGSRAARDGSAGAQG